jgi:hypothetical protein
LPEGQSDARPVFDRLGKNVPRFVEIIASIASYQPSCRRASISRLCRSCAHRRTAGRWFPRRTTYFILRVPAPAEATRNFRGGPSPRPLPWLSGLRRAATWACGGTARASVFRPNLGHLRASSVPLRWGWSGVAAAGATNRGKTTGYVIHATFFDWKQRLTLPSRVLFTF